MDWIKVKDEMPEEGDTVLCYNGIVCTGFVQLEDCRYESSKKGWNLDLIDSNEKEIFGRLTVTHWMPLPKPPLARKKSDFV